MSVGVVNMDEEHAGLVLNAVEKLNRAIRAARMTGLSVEISKVEGKGVTPDPSRPPAEPEIEVCVVRRWGGSKR